MGSCYTKSIEMQIIEDMEKYVEKSDMTEDQKKYAIKELKAIAEQLKGKSNWYKLEENDKMERINDLRRALKEIKFTFK